MNDEQCIECWGRNGEHRRGCSEGRKVREQEERRRAEQARRYPNQGYGDPYRDQITKATAALTEAATEFLEGVGDIVPPELEVEQDNDGDGDDDAGGEE